MGTAHRWHVKARCISNQNAIALGHLKVRCISEAKGNHCFELSISSTFSIEMSLSAITLLGMLNLGHSAIRVAFHDTDCLICSVLAAKNLGEPAYSNFLDHTYLGDRTTTIREYLATTGTGIMEEEPPESLKSRYGG